MATKVYRDLPWAQIRREWEHTSISIAALARKYNIRSATTLERRRVAEHWSRDADRQAAVPEATALSAPTLLTGPPFEAGGMIPLEAEAACDLTAQARTCYQRHVQQAHKIQDCGLLLLQRISGVLQAPGVDEASEATEAMVLGDLRRLIRVNPERETLASLLTTAAKTIDLGQAMERRAVTAEAASQVASDAAETPAGRSETLAGMLIPQMDMKMVEELRIMALEVKQTKR